MKLEVVGLGYIGLPTALLFASNGIKVVGVDTLASVVSNLNLGKLHIEEKGLAELLDETLANGLFTASLEVEKADVFIIAVPTPNLADEYGSCDVTAIVKAIKAILAKLEKGNTIIIESTIGPGVMANTVVPLIEETGFKVGRDVFVSHCPERVLPGNILQEIVQNSRVIGGVTQNCSKKTVDVYERVVSGQLFITSSAEAEMVKLVENTYRDVNIAFGNELVKICQKIGVNVHKVIELANQHPRVSVHAPGPGVGGHCLAVDPNFIAASAPNESPLIQLSRQINLSMPAYVVAQVDKLMMSAPTNKVAVFGMAYKGNVDDMRESPSVQVVQLLTQRGYDVAIYDPHIEQYANNYYSACQDSSLILIVTDHDEFKELVVEQTELMANTQVFDTKNCVLKLPENVTYINFGRLVNSTIVPLGKRSQKDESITARFEKNEGTYKKKANTGQ